MRGPHAAEVLEIFKQPAAFVSTDQAWPGLFSGRKDPSLPTPVRTHTHTQPQTVTHTCMHMHTNTQSHPHIRTDTHKNTRTEAHMHARGHTQTHSHPLWRAGED